MSTNVFYQLQELSNNSKNIDSISTFGQQILPTPDCLMSALHQLHHKYLTTVSHSLTTELTSELTNKQIIEYKNKKPWLGTYVGPRTTASGRQTTLGKVPAVA